MQSGSPNRAICVVSRTPVPGRVKTRLAADIGDEAAATLFRAFLRDVLVSTSSIPGAIVTITYPEDDDATTFKEFAPPGVRLRPESSRDFSLVLPEALRSGLELATVAALVGADSPDLPNEFVLRAYAALESGEADVAIGPTTDGGFYLLAVAEHHPDLFVGVDWSTNYVFDQTVASAATAGLRIEVLPEWYDVDRLSDLERLAENLGTDVALNAPATRAALRTLRDSGHGIPGPHLPWPVEEHRVIHPTPWRTLVADTVRTHVGEILADYSYLETERAVWVVPVTPEGRIVLIRQYRLPIREFIVEVPAGGGNEAPVDIARRELAEEVGGVASEWIEVARHYPASAHLTHDGYIFLALGVRFDRPEHESTELISMFTVPLDIAVDMARTGDVADSQSALAILAAEPIIRRKLATE